MRIINFRRKYFRRIYQEGENGSDGFHSVLKDTQGSGENFVKIFVQIEEDLTFDSPGHRVHSISTVHGSRTTIREFLQPSNLIYTYKLENEQINQYKILLYPVCKRKEQPVVLKDNFVNRKTTERPFYIQFVKCVRVYTYVC